MFKNVFLELFTEKFNNGIIFFQTVDDAGAAADVLFFRFIKYLL